MGTRRKSNMWFIDNNKYDYNDKKIEQPRHWSLWIIVWTAMIYFLIQISTIKKIGFLFSLPTDSLQLNELTMLHIATKKLDFVSYITSLNIYQQIIFHKNKLNS